jgi:hypothetical protein
LRSLEVGGLQVWGWFGWSWSGYGRRGIGQAMVRTRRVGLIAATRQGARSADALPEGPI